MRTHAHFVCCCVLLTVAAWPQSALVSTQDQLAKAERLYVQEGPKSALPEFEKALAAFHASKDRRGEAIALGYIANCHRRLGNLDQALGFAQQALHLKEESGDRDETGKTHNQLGLIYWERADYPSAVRHLQQAIETAAAVKDEKLEGSARNNLGLVFDEQGNYKQSLNQYQQALELHRSTHFERGEGDTLGNIGGVYLLLGRFRDALPYYQQSLAISKRLGLKPASSDDLGNIAICLAGTGDLQGALKSFDQALQIAHDTGLVKEEADWHKGKGTTLVGVGRFDAALHEYAAAEQVYEHAGLNRELVEALIDTGQLYGLLGDSLAAGERFDRALHLARRIGNGSGERASLLALGDLERHRRAFKSAEADFQKALQSARAAGEQGTIVLALLQLTRNNLDRNQYKDAWQSASEAEQIAERSGNRPAVALSYYLLGEVQRSQRQLGEAIKYYSAAQAIQEQMRDPELGWRIYYRRGQALAAEHKTGDAISAYQQAIRIIEETRSAISEERYRAGYTEQRYQVYVALVELLLKIHKPQTAFLYSEKLRARAYFDLFGQHAPGPTDPGIQERMDELGEQIRTLRRAIRKEYSVPRDERRGQALESYSEELAQAERKYEALLGNAGSAMGPHDSVPSVTELQHHLLHADTALIEYVVGTDKVSILLLTRSSVAGLIVPVNSESLSSRTELLRSLIAERRPEWIEPARGLRKLLVDPIQAKNHLRSVRQLLIVPDGVLNYVPFAALPMDNNQFLGDEFTIAYLPAAAALARDSRSGGGRKLLAMAPSMAKLPNARAEVLEIGDVFGPGSRVVVGKKATKTLFMQIAGNYEYLHLATHSRLNRNAPSLSAVELEPDRDSDGRLELYEIVGMRLHARLVTLSACETALGRGYFTETPGGDEFVGLTRAFLSAGSQNVLAGLWAVNDASTRMLMLRFYRQLLVSNPAEALARAQQQVRRSDVRYRHPYYWAPFIIMGPAN